MHYFIIYGLLTKCEFKINLLLTEREGRTGEYWPEFVAVRTERSEVRTKTTEGQYSPVRLEQARLVSSLLYGTRVMLVSKLPAFENKKYTSYDHFHGNGPYGKIPTKKEPIRTPGFTPRLPCHIIRLDIGQVLFCVFMDRDGVEDHKIAKKNETNTLQS